MNNRSNDLREDISPAAPFLRLGQPMLQLAHPIDGFVPRDMAVPKDVHLAPNARNYRSEARTASHLR
ncbi:MAG: hypothetical protein HN611_04285 [Gemmatimonadetes bacterium]|nr:hypothetical protein [Gemmatimonadota bacterium]